MFASFEFLGKTISMYFVMALLGIFAAGLFACIVAKKRGHDDNDMIVTLLIAAVGVLLGGHILYGITNTQYLYLIFNVSSFEEFLETAKALFGGSVFYGGLFGGMIAGRIYMDKKKLDYREFSDILAPAVPLFHTFGRIGCFLGGCCYGIECEHGLTTTHSLMPLADGVPRFPVQLLEASCNLVLFIVLALLLKNGRLRGRLFELYLFCYSIIRFSDEFLRGDEYRGFLFGFSTSQLISMGLFLGVIVLAVVKKLKKPAEPEKTDEEKPAGE